MFCGLLILYGVRKIYKEKVVHDIVLSAIPLKQCGLAGFLREKCIKSMFHLKILFFSENFCKWLILGQFLAF